MMNLYCFASELVFIVMRQSFHHDHAASMISPWMGDRSSYKIVEWQRSDSAVWWPSSQRNYSSGGHKGYRLVCPRTTVSIVG